MGRGGEEKGHTTVKWSKQTSVQQNRENRKVSAQIRVIQFKTPVGIKERPRNLNVIVDELVCTKQQQTNQPNQPTNQPIVDFEFVLRKRTNVSLEKRKGKLTQQSEGQEVKTWTNSGYEWKQVLLRQCVIFCQIV